MNQINPYRRNCEIMRAFFAKPIFLIMGIVLLVLSLSQLTAEFISGRFLLSIIAFLPCVTIFTLFFIARSKKPLVSFKAPIVTMQIFSIVGIVLLSLAAIVMLYFLFLVVLIPALWHTSTYDNHSLFQNIFDSFVRTYSIIFLPAFALVSALIITYFAAMLRLFNSFNKSTSTVYLQKNGAVFFSVISIILAVLTAVIFSDILFFSDSGHNLMLTIYDITKAINYISYVAVFALSAVIGLMYNSYIKKYIFSINAVTPAVSAPTVASPVQNKSTTVSMWEEAEQNNPFIQQNHSPSPASFNPQPVFNPENTKPQQAQNLPTNVAGGFTPQNPYEQQSAQPQFKRCANCGKENPSNNLFCGECGTRL